MSFCDIFHASSGCAGRNLLEGGFLAVQGSLIVLLAVLIRRELRTGLIQNKILFPAALFFLVLNAFAGCEPLFSYPAGLIISLFTALMFSYAYFGLTQRVGLGGGAIKLLAVVGAAMGLAPGFAVTALVLSAVLIVILMSSLSSSSHVEVPSSPIVLSSVLVIDAFRFMCIGP